MVLLKRSSLIALSLLFSIFVVACANPLSPGGNGYTQTTTPAQNNNPPAVKKQPETPKAPNKGTTATGNMNAFIHTTQVMIPGIDKPVTVLTTATGMMLYYRKSDPIPQSTCTGPCAKIWPPLLSNTMTITSSVPLPLQLTVVKTANGNQVEYDGHPLYTYSGDTMPQQFSGRGLGMVWYLVGTML